MNNRWSDIRDNVVAAIKALPNINGTPVEKLGIPADLFRFGHRTAIGVCLAEDQWDRANHGIADYRDNPAEISVPIVILGTAEYPVEAALDGDGMIEELCAVVLGSNRGTVGPGIRGVNVGTEDTGPVYLEAEKSQIVPGKDRAEGSGGPLVKILEMKSTVLPL